MKYKSVSTFAAILWALLAFFAASCTAPPQADAPEVFLTLEGTLNGQGKFLFRGDTIRYAPGEHQAPADVTIDGRPWKDLNQPFKLDFTPDFENVIIADRAGGNGVMLNRRSERAELTLFIVDAHAPAPHFVVRLVVKNVSSSRTELARLNPSELPSGPIPFQQQLQMALERRTVLEKTIRNLELVPDFPEESIDEVRRQLRDLDRMIEPLKEIVEKEAAGDANEPASPSPADYPSARPSSSISNFLPGACRTGLRFIADADRDHSAPRWDEGIFICNAAQKQSHLRRVHFLHEKTSPLILRSDGCAIG